METAEKELYERIASKVAGKYDSDPEGYIFSSGAITWENGDRVFIGLDLYPDQIRLSVIRAEPEGKGIGTHVLNALKRVAEEEHLAIVATEVDAPDYFAAQGFTPEPDWDEELTGEPFPNYWWSASD